MERTTFPSTDDEIFVNFIGVGNAINFAFADFDTHRSFSLKYQQMEWNGAFAMWAGLSRALESGVDFRRLDWLETLTVSDAEFLFRGESTIPMLPERVELLRKTGAMLSRKFGGSYSALVDRSNLNAFGEMELSTFWWPRSQAFEMKAGTKAAELFLNFRSVHSCLR